MMLLRSNVFLLKLLNSMCFLLFAFICNAQRSTFHLNNNIPFEPSLIMSGMVLYLDAGNTSSYPGSGTTWTDLTGNGNNVILTNGPSFNSSDGGQIIMDGVNDYATSSGATGISATSGNNSRTVIVWYKSTANSNTTLIDKGSTGTAYAAEQLFIVNANGMGGSPPLNIGGISVVFWGNDLFYPIASTTLFDGNWHFVAYTYDNTNRSVRMCFDGTFATTVYRWGPWATMNGSPFVLPNSLNTTNNSLWIGRTRNPQSGIGGYYANASIPQVIMYNRSLSEAEILNNFSATRTRYGR